MVSVYSGKTLGPGLRSVRLAGGSSKAVLRNVPLPLHADLA